MDSVTAALVAALVAWTSIFVVVKAPPVVAWHRLRPAGAVAIALFGLMVMGVPISPAIPLAVLLLGVVFVVARGKGPVQET